MKMAFLDTLAVIALGIGETEKSLFEKVTINR